MSIRQLLTYAGLFLVSVADYLPEKKVVRREKNIRARATSRSGKSSKWSKAKKTSDIKD